MSDPVSINSYMPEILSVTIRRLVVLFCLGQSSNASIWDGSFSFPRLGRQCSPVRHTYLRWHHIWHGTSRVFRL